MFKLYGLTHHRDAEVAQRYTKRRGLFLLCVPLRDLGVSVVSSSTLLFL
jgi:hypothetical protein